MDSVSSADRHSNSNSKSDSVSELLASVEKIKMTTTNYKPLSQVFTQSIEPKNLRERFLYMTFEIIADLGADALSASELIKRTKSSKGALFHHFETIDHLCIESLVYFKRHLSASIPKDHAQNLEEYLNFFLEDNLQRQSTKAYVHLVHFFRDRALRDERYREPLKALFEVYMHMVTDRILTFLPASKREEVFSKVVFMAMTVERASFHRALYQDQKAFQKELEQFLNAMLVDMKN